MGSPGAETRALAQALQGVTLDSGAARTERVRVNAFPPARDAETADDTLAEQIRRGDDGAFDALFDRYAGPLLAYLEGMTRDRAAAEDLLQETLLRVHRHIDRYEERGAFRAWVFRTATNVALTELRRRRYAGGESLDGAALAVRAPERDEPEQRFADRQRAAAVEDALARLAPEHRAVVLLRVREDMGTREIAETLRVPEGTVKSRMHHAVRQLREWIERGVRPGREGARP